MKFKVNNEEVFASTGGRPFDKDKPLIVFVHGSGLTHMVWVLQTRYFAFHGYSVLALDMPGHGLSGGKSLKSIECMADWVNDVIDAVDFKEASLVGHSQGCLVTIECASRCLIGPGPQTCGTALSLGRSTGSSTRARRTSG